MIRLSAFADEISADLNEQIGTDSQRKFYQGTLGIQR